MSKILKEYYIYGDDGIGNFTGNFKVGDYVRIETHNKDIKCVIREVTIDEDIKVEDDNYEEHVFNITEIVGIYDVFC